VPAPEGVFSEVGDLYYIAHNGDPGSYTQRRYVFIVKIYLTAAFFSESLHQVCGCRWHIKTGDYITAEGGQFHW